jgi:8-oxo-dGTP diphosphatase
MEWNQFLTKILALSKIGLKFSQDPYALENYAELKQLTLEQMQAHSQKDEPIEIFPYDVYPTPNLSVRVLIFNAAGALLLGQEKADGAYAAPGGWCDLFESPRDNAVREVKQETNLDIEIERLLAIVQRDKYKQKASTLSEYTLYFSARVVGGELKANHEIESHGYFPLIALPPLSFKMTQAELDLALSVYLNRSDVYVD